MIKSNGGIIGPDNVTRGGPFGSASGVFKLGEATDLINESKWPTPGPQGHQVANSCRFEGTSNDNLTLTPSSTGNRSKFTISFWIKRAKLGGSDPQRIFSVDTGTTTQEAFVMFETDDSFRLFSKYDGSNIDINYDTNRVFRDTSAWYHMVWRVDTTESTEANRVRLYVNGVEETSFASQTEPSQNDITRFNEASRILRIGERSNGNDDISCYLAEVVMLDGQALAPTSFGEFNSQTGIWVPKVVTGLTFGTNGFYLPFTNASALGEDFSGQNNDFTVNNLTSLDQSTDTCSTNFATMSPIDFAGSAPTLSNGNLTVATSSADRPIRATMGFSKGKWYAEYRFEASDNDNHIGCYSLENSLSTTYIGGNLYSWGLVTSSGQKRNNGASTAYGSAIGYSNSIVMIAIDKDNGKIWWGKDGTWFASGDPANGTNEAFSNINTVVGADGFVTFADLTYRNGSWNYGSPSFAISSGNTDQNGFGNFEYAPPAGYLSLNTKNLAAVLA